MTVDYTGVDVRKIYANQPNGWKKVWISVYVCNDTNRDGRCSDEVIYEQISNMSPTHQMCHLPSAIPVDVWDCR